MGQEALFLAFAAMGITLAGFSGLVSAFHPHETWQPQDERAVRTILAVAFGAGLAGSLPVVSSVWFDSTVEAVVLSSVILAFYIAVVFALEIRDLSSSDSKYGNPRWPILYWTSFLVPCVPSIIIELMNAWFWKSIGPHSAVTFWLLVVGCIQFSLVAGSPRSSTESK